MAIAFIGAIFLKNNNGNLHFSLKSLELYFSIFKRKYFLVSYKWFGLCCSFSKTCTSFEIELFLKSRYNMNISFTYRKDPWVIENNLFMLKSFRDHT